MMIVESIQDRCYRLITHRSVRRSWPNDSERVINTIGRSLTKSNSLSFGIEWFGAKPLSNGIAGDSERRVLSRLEKNIVNKLLALGVDRVTVDILFMDVNASFFQGSPEEEISNYWDSFSDIVSHYDNFRISKASQEVFPAGSSDDKIFQAINNSEKARKKYELTISNGLIEKIKHLSAKHSYLVKNGSVGAEEIARRYVLLKAYATDFYASRNPDKIFISFAYPEINNLISSGPIIYTFSMRKGCSECPWFTK